MEKRYKEISFLSFQKQYKTQEDCEKKLLELLRPRGFVCPACGHQMYYPVSGGKLCQCERCKHQTPSTTDTVMGRNRLFF